MKHTLPARARVVIVGGGVAGCSTAYHLAKRGWTDVVLLERKRLTSGTTWHAAGLITQARPTYGTREIVRRSLRVFQTLEEETGFATGFERTGTLHLADGAERLEELLRQASAARANGITAEPISPEQAVELFPPLYAGDLAGAVYYPDDGRGNATDTTMALAAGARQHGVRIVENTPVTGVTRRDGRVTGVTTEHGDIEAEYVVAAAGMWGREFGALAGVGIPLQALAQRVTETLDLAYEIHWPYQQRSSVRGLRRSPLHDRVTAAGAVFGELLGWERANWYAPPGVPRTYEYSFGRQNWFEHSAAEHRAVREAAGLFDTSSFGKLLVQGRDAEAVLQRVGAGDVAVEPGRIVYTQWLNSRGGIEADVTVTRLAETRFLVLSGPATLARDRDWLERHIGPDEFAVVTDISQALAMVPVMGPNARRLLHSLTDADLSAEAFPFGTSREIDLGCGFVRATRITYVGELGWELLIPADLAVHVYDTIAGAGQEYGLRPAGYHALDSLRMEKAYRSWGHDISAGDTPLEAGLGFAVAWDKPGGFTGRDALLRQKEAGVGRRLVQFALRDPDAFAYHDEPVYRDGALAGRVSSAAYGHTLGRTVALGYVTAPEPGTPPAWYAAGEYEIEIAGERVPADASLRPLYDPTSERPRA